MVLPDLDSLRCFDAAARRLSFAAAARDVALSPPAFTARIRQLEDALGAKLFRRQHRRVELTQAGQRLLPQARRTLDDAVRCMTLARDESSPEPYELTIGTLYEVGLQWLVPSLSRLRLSRPERSLHLVFGDSPDLLRGVREGTLDAAVTSARISDAVFQHIALHEARFALVAAPALIRRNPLLAAPDARNHVLLDVRAELPLFRYFSDAQPPSAVWAFSRIERLGTVGAIAVRLLCEAGVAVMPIAFIRRHLESGRLVQLFPEVELRTDQFRLVWPREHQRERELRELAADLSAAFDELREPQSQQAGARRTP
ncbi:MAG TPA: LysR family transcriptional regulator [Myxococcales bacterium]|jgi:LysR family glycine cleavage system transcriptional activator|nr:LysR family transcriptional regulator [Myxococcales bacterium]